MALTFRGGVDLNFSKNTRKSPVENLPAPGFVSIPVSQYPGAPAEFAVQAGDIVDKGQLIGQTAGNLSCPVHASVSGRVAGTEHGIITIENDYADRLHAGVAPFNKRISETSADEIIGIIKQAGISEPGGLPAYAKIQVALNRVSTLIINGAESEPYVTAAHRLMLEQPEFVINGVKILLKALGLKKCLIAIEDNKLNAADSLTAAAKKNKMIGTRLLKSKYPQDDERQLIYALTGREPGLSAKKLPVDYGYAVFSAETAAAICRVFVEGTPVIDRIVTVDGDCIANPKNLRAPLGAPVSALIAYCGLKTEPRKIIRGGPMTGAAVLDPGAPVIKSTSAVLVFSDRNYKSRECIHCGRCAESCPMRLQPLYFAQAAQNAQNDDTYELSMDRDDIMSCTECGCCEYICPGGVPLLRHIRDAKERA